VNNDVLDASAVLAAVQNEPGGEEVYDLLDRDPVTLAISSVNLCEAVTRLVRDGMAAGDAETALRAFRDYVVSFDHRQAVNAAALYGLTSKHGLSLGDRACLALALARGSAVAWTTDREWQRVDVGVQVRMLR
jgi:ribonuclease VapC